MNLVGKILVVALFVMALMFSAFTLAVHSTHKNWKNMVLNPEASPGNPLGLKPQLEASQAEVKRLQDQIADLERNYERNKREYQQRLGQLETALITLTKERDVLQDDNGRLGKELEAAVAAADVKTKQLDSFRAENQKLRDDNDTVRKERDDKLREVVSLQDRVAQLTSEYDRYRRRNEQLLVQITQMRVAMMDAGIQLDRDVTVFGKVQATKTTADFTLVEISVGYDDGLEEGKILDVFRVGPAGGEALYLGRIKLTRVEPDVSVGQVLPGSKGSIQRHDHVATRLSFKSK